MKQISVAALLVSLGVAFNGCGSGTAGGGIHIQGAIGSVGGHTSSEGINVTSVQTGSGSTTDSSGRFAFDTQIADISLLLRFEGAGVSNEIEIEVPADAEIADLVLTLVPEDASELSKTQFRVELLSISFLPGSTTTPISSTTTTTSTAGPGRTTTTTLRSAVPENGFDSNGNTAGFGIPEGLTGNISKGNREWSRVCSSCHLTEKSRKRFNDVKAALRTQLEMRTLKVSNQQVADVVAYLNRGSR